MTAPDSISGTLDEKYLRRQIRLSRRGAIGPTAIYYAGVTAPIISASMSVMMRNAIEMAGLSAYWQWFLSALVAALAGISWYLIFIRWSYRSPDDLFETGSPKLKVWITDTCLKVQREGVETLIDWEAVTSVKSGRGHTLIRIRGDDVIIIPDAWFGNNKQVRRDFADRLKMKADV